MRPRGYNVGRFCRVFTEGMGAVMSFQETRRRCPVCGARTVTGRRVYCTDRCRKAAQMRRYRARRSGLLRASDATTAVPEPRRWVEGRSQRRHDAPPPLLNADWIQGELYELAELSDELVRSYRSLVERIEAIQRTEAWRGDPAFASLEQALGYAAYLAGIQGQGAIIDAAVEVTGHAIVAMAYPCDTDTPLIEIEEFHST